MDITSSEFSNHLVTVLEAAQKVLSERWPGFMDLSPADRLLEVRSADAGYQVHIASEGLDLDGKIELERFVHNKVKSWRPEATPAVGPLDVGVYFRRKKPMVPKPSPARPAAQEKPSAFGLRVNRRAIPGVRDVIVVASGKGGVGKSTVSVNLAVALAQRGKAVGLLDADIYGPSAPTMLGLSGPMTVGEGERILPVAGHGITAVSFGFLTDADSPMISRGPVISKALQQLCYQTAWGDLDYLVFDLPPGTGDIQLTLVQDVPIAGAVIVTTAQEVALIDAQKAITMFRKLNVPILGLVENMAEFVCPRCDHHEALFGTDGVTKLSRERGIPVIGRIPLAREIIVASDEGKPVALYGSEQAKKPFAAIADAVSKA